MKEIGKLAGVSQPTVSVVLNGKGDEKGIAQKTQQKILEIAENHGFRTNAIARSMKTGRTGIIGIIVSKDAVKQTIEYRDNGVSDMHLHSSLLLAGCRVMIEVVDEQDFQKQKMPEILTDGLVDGVIMLSSADNESAFTKYLERMSKYTPHILLINDITKLEISNISADEFEIGEKAANYFWEWGYRSFATISCAERRIALESRLNAFRKRIEELSHGEIDITTINAGNRWSIDCGREGIKQLLKQRGSYPGAIFCANDFFAYGAEMELLEQGFSIPDDVAILGVGESKLASYAPVPISTLGISLEDKTAAIIEILKDWQQGGTTPIKKQLKSTVYKRNSTII